MCREIFIDTWAWMALTNRQDKDHAAAEQANRQFLEEGFRLVTSNFILSESYTLIRLRIHHKAAVDFRRKILGAEAAGLVLIMHIDRDIEDEAWDIFERYEDKDFSFADCSSFVIMKRRGIKEAFTADNHFIQMGFGVAP